jgi:hypothetical protein
MMKEHSAKKAKRSALSLFVVFGTVLVCLAEAIALGIIFRRQRLNLNQGFYIYLLPICVAVPAVQGLRLSRSIKKQFSLLGDGQQDPNKLLHRLVIMVGVVYAALVMIMILLLPH